MKKLIYLPVCLGMLFFSAACENWFDVSPKSDVKAEDLFQQESGFRDVLTGVYSLMSAPESYGRQLSFGYVDVLAQYYNISGNTHRYIKTKDYLYREPYDKEVLSTIWSRQYKGIANLNAMLMFIDEQRGVFSGDEVYRIYKGEILALRGMLHFDMLRLFGPLTSELDKESIPYQTNSDQTVTPLLSGSEVVGLILDDLKNAVGLLKDTDPYFVEEEFSDTDLNYRRFRMNYFAAKGLMARVQLWGGDKEKAAATAKEVIAEGQAEGAEFFPFVTNSEATSSNPDRVFYSEVLFGTYHSSREKLHEDLFAPTLESTSILTLAGTARRDDLYDNENDYRYSVWSTYNKNGTSVLYHRKFEKQDNVTASRQYMIPLIRMSEMYLIAVECCKLDEASVYLNTFRNARNCNSLALTEDNRINILANEYKKEMLGEGQLFFFYKRQEMVNIPDGNQATGTKNVELTKYVVPLPESETDQRISSTDISNE